MKITLGELREIIQEVLGLKESDPKVGHGKKPAGSGRRLYTDEDPSDTVRVKFSTASDIRSTLAKKSFKSKSHARQSQIINLIHQRVRAAHDRAKDPKVKARLARALEYAEERKEASKRKTKRMREGHEVMNMVISKDNPIIVWPKVSSLGELMWIVKNDIHTAVLNADTGEIHGNWVPQHNEIFDAIIGALDEWYSTDRKSYDGMNILKVKQEAN